MPERHKQLWYRGASVPSVKGAPPPRKWDRKSYGSQARASALTAARALIGNTCTRLWVEHSMDMGKGLGDDAFVLQSQDQVDFRGIANCSQMLVRRPRGT